MEINRSPELYDALIVGGGPAGLSAAIYLARWCRSVAVAECARPGRSDWKQTNHNYLGFPDGVAAADIVALGRQQAERYGARFFDAEIASLVQEDGVFKAEAPGGLCLQARGVILATGVRDKWVEFPGYEGFIGRSIHWCIVCDGYEMRGKRVTVAGNDAHTAEMAIQMLRFTPDVTIVTNTGSLGITPDDVQRLDHHHIRLVVGRIAGAKARPKEAGMLASLRLEGGEEIPLDHLFSAQGAEPNVALARSLGVEIDETGYITADPEGTTAVPGVFAAGDVTRQLAHQIVTAAHEGAAAANALNHRLFEQDEEGFRVGHGRVESQESGVGSQE